MTTKLKKLWLFVASAVMAITAIFAVGCDNGEGEGNACATHTYGEWVIVKEPTETEKGLSTHVPYAATLRRKNYSRLPPPLRRQSKRPL